MAIVPTIHHSIFYVLKCQRDLPETQQMRFKLRPLSLREFTELGKFNTPREQADYCIKIGLLAVDNMPEGFVFDKENYDQMLTLAVVNEVSGEVARLSTVSEDEKKTTNLRPLHK